MLRLVTGLPGSYKTAFTLAEFLAVTDRQKFATHIGGFDYEKHNVTYIESLDVWPTLPDGSLIFVDEAQKFLRPRGKEGSLPQWVADFETHRHRGFDFLCTTQNPMMIDVHFRRLTGEHWHYYRPFGMRKASILKWSKCQDDVNDRRAIWEAVKSREAPPPDIFKEYTSTVMDTHKSKMPKKLLWLPVLVCVFIGIMAYVYQHFMHRGGAGTIGMPTPTVAAGQGPAPTAVPGGANQARPVTLADFQPVSPVLPWSAPFYKDVARPVTFPKFAGCIVFRGKCQCVTQQGTDIQVEQATCVDVVSGKGMPFNPFKADSPDLPYRPELAAADNKPQNHEVLIIGADPMPDVEKGAALPLSGSGKVVATGPESKPFITPSHSGAPTPGGR